VVRKFTDLGFRLRPAAVGAVVAIGLLATLCGPSRAQVVRVNQTDPDTNKLVIAVVAPARDTRAAFVVTCNSHYAVRTYEVSRVFTPWAKLAVQFGQYQPIAADGEVKAPDQLRITLAPDEQERFASELRAIQQLSVRITEGSALLAFQFDWRADSEAAFGVTAVTYGVDVQQAAAGFGTLTQGLSQAAAGQYPELASLLNGMRIEWRYGGKPVETGLVIGRIMDALAATTVEGAGQLMFGQAWPALQPMAQAPRGDRYTDRNRSMDQQLAWLRGNCAP
jgi:hypothetical protein